MAFVLNDRVRESTSTNGTSNFSLGGAVTGGFVTFSSACSNGDTFHYCAQNTSASEWEVGLGTYTSSGNVLTRPGSVLANSLGTTAKISFTNNPTVFMTIAGTTNLERVMNPSNTIMLGGNNLADLSSAATSRVNLGVAVFAIPFIIDGGGSVISTGVKGDITIPFACTITGAILLADQSGSIVVDIWKDTYANYPPTVADTITASAKPTLSSATKSTDSTLTGWTTSVAAGDVLRYNVDSVATVTRVLVSLTATR
jgi:hypothetical protein